MSSGKLASTLATATARSFSVWSVFARSLSTAATLTSMRAISGSTSRTASPRTASIGCCDMRFSWSPCSDVIAPAPSREPQTGNTGLAGRVVPNSGITSPLLPRASSPRGRLCEQFASLANLRRRCSRRLGSTTRPTSHLWRWCPLMPQDSRRRRAPARHHRSHAQDDGWGRSDLGAAPAPRGRPARPDRRDRRDRPGRAVRPATRRRPTTAAPDQPQGELDRALAAAADAPPPAETTFRELGLPARLVAELADRGIDAPFAIQARALPDALAGRDVPGPPPPGSGKTLAFGLPVLARLAAGTGRRREKGPRAPVLVPPRELARQVADVLMPLGQPLGVSVTTVYAGVVLGRQIDRRRRGVDIVGPTPARLIDLPQRQAVPPHAVE